MKLSLLCGLPVVVGVKALVQILFKDFQSIFLEMQKLDLGQEHSFLDHGANAVADDLDDFLRGIA